MYYIQKSVLLNDTIIGLKKLLLDINQRSILLIVPILMTNVNSDTFWFNKFFYAPSNMVTCWYISLFSTDNFVKMSLGRCYNHSISALAK